MSRMHYLTVALLLVTTAGVAWYTTREITRGQDRVETLTGRLNDATTRADLLGERIRQLEANQPSGPASRPALSGADFSPADLSLIGSDRLRNYGGLEAIEAQMVVIANNIANVNSVGFKRRQAVLEENPHGMGSRLADIRNDMTIGSLIQTDRPLDVMIAAEGFFMVTTRYNGEEIIAYTRAGNFFRNANGDLVLGNSEGSKLEPPITLGEDDQLVEIENDGRVTVVRGGGTERHMVGRFELARFSNPEGLKAIGKNLYVETDVSGPPITGGPTENGLGPLIGRCLEGSNVSIERERVDMAFAPRAFEINSQYLQGLAYRTALASPTPPVIPIPQPTLRDSR